MGGVAASQARREESARGCFGTARCGMHGMGWRGTAAIDHRVRTRGLLRPSAYLEVTDVEALAVLPLPADEDEATVAILLLCGGGTAL